MIEPLRKKFIRHFKVRDTNKDGVIELSDYEQCARNLADLRGWAPGTEEFERVLAMEQAVWAFFWKPADADGDDRVTLEEHLAFLSEVVGEVTEETLAASRAHSFAIFDTLDADDDGRISADEYRQFIEATGEDTSWVQEAFSRLDPDGNGYLTREQFEMRHREFFTSTDPDAPGNWFYGPLE